MILESRPAKLNVRRVTKGLVKLILGVDASYLREQNLILIINRARQSRFYYYQLWKAPILWKLGGKVSIYRGWAALRDFTYCNIISAGHYHQPTVRDGYLPRFDAWRGGGSWQHDGRSMVKHLREYCETTDDAHIEGQSLKWSPTLVSISDCISC